MSEANKPTAPIEGRGIGLHHVAIWVTDLDAAARFWRDNFDATIGTLYESRRVPGFRSRFVTLPSGLRLELMTKPGLKAGPEQLGWAHIALSLGSTQAVDQMARRFASMGKLALGPRTTGDGFYEAVVQGPDGLTLELTL